LAPLKKLSSLLLANNSIEFVDPSLWQSLLETGYLSLLDMTGNPSQCFLGVGYSSGFPLTAMCECAPGYVGKTFNGSDYANGCVLRKNAAFFPPAIAVTGVPYVIEAQNMSQILPQMCTSPGVCTSEAAGNNSISVTFGATGYLIGSWWTEAGPSSNVFFPSASIALQAASRLGTLVSASIQSHSISMSLTANQNFSGLVAVSPFVPNVILDSQALFSFNASLPAGITLDSVQGLLSGAPVSPAGPANFYLFQTSSILNYSALLTIVNLSVVECNDSFTCKGGTCDFQGSPYDGLFQCFDCPSNLTGMLCQYDNPFTADDDNASIAASFFAVAGLLVLVVWWSRTREAAQSLLVQLQYKETEMGAMRRIWQIPAGELVIGSDIAAGSFGKVMRALWNDIPVAVKYLSATGIVTATMDKNAAADFERECAFMKSVRHPNIILFFGAGRFDDGTPFLVLELAERGSLREVLETAGTEVIEWDRKLVFARDTALGMQHLHSLGCIHRDLKSGNLLVTQNYHIKVADFGTSKLAESLQQQQQQQQHRRGSMATFVLPTNGTTTVTMTKMIGTPLWMAPELLEGKRSYDNKVDVYSYGIVLFEILTQMLPWFELGKNLFLTVLEDAVLSGRRPAIPESVVCPDEQYIELMEKCWAQQGRDRPPFSVVVGHPLLQASRTKSTASVHLPMGAEDVAAPATS
jgi:hypothetical protein